MAIDCGVCLDMECDNDVSVLHTARVVKARKLHQCCECGSAISIGESYERATALYDRIWTKETTCLCCTEIRDLLTCGNGYIYGLLWGEIREQVFPYMTTGCIAKLTTAKAKHKLTEAWRKWKEL